MIPAGRYTDVAKHDGMPPPSQYQLPGNGSSHARLDLYQPQHQHPLSTANLPPLGASQPQARSQNPQAQVQPQLHAHHPAVSQQHHQNGIEPTRQASVNEKPYKRQQAMSRSCVDRHTNRRFRLDVVQQPERARMCGYGDKDRRPITPPPCVRLVITDATTGEEISCRDLEYPKFVLNVDLWDERGGSEVNLCRQPISTGTPAISPGITHGYPTMNGTDSANSRCPPQPGPPTTRDTGNGYTQPPTNLNGSQEHVVVPPNGFSQPNATTPYPPNGTYGPPQQYFPAHSTNSSHSYNMEQSTATLPPSECDLGLGYIETSSSSVAYVHDQYKGALNRNLIGSVAASAFCLTDTSGREGIWFVLQDLSVRLEGKYRLKFSFINVTGALPSAQDLRPDGATKIRAPILAVIYSNPFQVFSAKKFPGVWESTPLSKAFAIQGIKIPIRKDGGKGADDEEMG